MLVYLMGLTDIFAAMMLVTGIKPQFILIFTIALLAFKGLSSFMAKPHPLLYVMGGADLVAIILLWQGMVLGNIGTVVLLVMLFKGFISFWELKLLRNATLNIAYLFYLGFRTGTKTNKNKWISSAANYLWFGSTKIQDARVHYPEEDYAQNEYNYFSAKN